MAYWGEIKELEKPMVDYVVYECPNPDKVESYKELEISFVSDITLNEQGFHLKFSDDFRDAIPLEKLDDAKTFRSMCEYITHHEQDFHVMRINYQIRFRQECDLDF